MTRMQTTAAYVAVAGLLTLAAYVTAPRRVVPVAERDRGQPFFPRFTDPNAATSLEVIEFDEQTFVARPFKVLNRDGKWTIPSHYDYPADAGDRLPLIAAAVISLKKGDVASENAADQERCGVLDPLDETLATPKGRGARVTVKGRNDKVLADIIYGAPVEGRPSQRYVRLPEERRIYVADVGQLKISTGFQEWVDRDLLHVDRHDVDRILVRNYTVEVARDRVTPREMLSLSATGRDEWALDGISPSERLDTFHMNLLVTRLDDLAMVDVRPKLPAVTALLAGAGASETAKLPQPEVDDLARKGFFLTPQGILGSEGDVVVHTTSGIFFTLRFGRIVTEAVEALGRGSSPAQSLRYLFISANVEPPAADRQVSASVQNQLAVLRARFAPWYYVISNDDFLKIRLLRRELVRSRGPGAAPPPTAPQG